MLTTQQFNQFLEATNVYRLGISRKHMEQFVEVYSYIFDQAPPCTACPGDIESAIHKLKVYESLLVKTQNESIVKASKLMKYTMKEGVVVFSNSLNMMVSVFNCTDDIAELLIKEQPENASLFTINVTDTNTYSATPDELEPAITEAETAVVQEKGKRKRK